jgi:alpha-galactosidase
LRIDLGLLGHVHAAFLSDPDWMEFHLQLLWGAAQSVPAAAILHFTESDWRTFHPLQNFDSATADIDDIDAIMRSVLLHRFGLSYALPRWTAELRDRIR